MIQPGLVSVTFRQLAPAKIIDLARDAGLAAIEWGGDIHVPHGDLKQAETVGRLTRRAGLAVASYGSYYHVLDSEQQGLTFDSVLRTAQALGAPMIRVWAGILPSAKADDAYRRSIVEETRRLAKLASAAGLVIAFEYHGNTLTDTRASAVELLNAIQHPAVHSYWQATIGMSGEDNLAGLSAILPWLANVHVAHYALTGATCLALKSGADGWRRYLDLVRTTGRKHYALLEFVRDDSPAAFREDARTLQEWLAS